MALSTTNSVNNVNVEIPIEVFLPCYRHLLNSTADIDFLWGGRDSGKSYFIACILVVCCMESEYFRCVLVRKVGNTIRESQYQLIHDVVNAWGLHELFTFKESTLEIKCNNGNRFISRGMDEPGKLKSVSNPSHCWAEEMNQLDLDDFVIVMTSLRYNQGKVKLWCSFNPECDGDYEDFWLYKTFFKEHSDIYSTFESTWKIPVGEKIIEFKYGCTWTTYKDNPYCKDTRKAFLENLEQIEPYYYTTFTLGFWGNRSVQDPYCLCFDKKKHIGPTNWIRQQMTYLSFDFNRSPITCGVYQHDLKKINCVESINIDKSNIYELCGVIKLKYNGTLYMVTGDATGRNSSALVKDAKNYYTVIKAELMLTDQQIKVPSVNPPIEENRVLVNSVLQKMDVKMDPIKCKSLIFDCQNVGVTDMGKIDKGTRSDPKKRADHLDHFRYYLNTFHKHVLKNA